ncbi:unnamed protein product [Dovyalis caffra]|uniref:Uncharacterized protein n=1 Tax=Dovyalis caffra TaxID=77055 RepID=A0AAV1RFA3_9ROSI|nr:unnamed protein product [Dovyalis caffra]
MRVRARSYGEEGRSSHIVDANLSVLRGRIEEIGAKERLERCYRSSCMYGWNYAPGYDCKLKKERDFYEYFELAGLVGGTIGITCLSGTAFLSLASLLVHLNQ